LGLPEIPFLSSFCSFFSKTLSGPPMAHGLNERGSINNCQRILRFLIEQ
jgi:hypothetical protein